LRQVTHRRLLQQAHQKSGSFPPPALPSFIGTTTLSDSRSSRCPTAPLRPLPSLSTGLPRLRDPLSRRAVPITPVDRSRCVCRLLPQIVLPSPNSGRVGVHNFPFEACSGFIRITARRVARPPEADPGLRRGRLLSQGFDPADCSTEPPASYRANRPLPGWDLHPQGDRPLRGAPEIANSASRRALERVCETQSEAPFRICSVKLRVHSVKLRVELASLPLCMPTADGSSHVPPAAFTRVLVALSV